MSSQRHGRLERVGARAWLRRSEPAAAGAWGRVKTGTWPALQQTLAAVASWVIAHHLFDHRQPLFAPIAALVGLNASHGERGSNAVRLLLGVGVGIVVADAATALLGDDMVSTLALAVFVAIMIPVLVGAGRIVMAQAGVSAIIAVFVGRPQSRPERLLDACIGVAVALVVSQLLLPASPVAFLRKAEADALRQMADALWNGATALHGADPVLAQRVLDDLQDLGESVGDLRSVQIDSSRAARRSPVWWARVGAVKRERAAASRLLLVGSECLMLIRASVVSPPEGRGTLVVLLRRLADILSTLAGTLDDAEARRRKGDEVLGLVGELVRQGDRRGVAVEAVYGAMCGLALDIGVFCGSGEEQALDAVHTVIHSGQRN